MVDPLSDVIFSHLVIRSSSKFPTCNNSTLR